MDVDTDIEELKGEVEELKQLTADTNRQVRKMRRSIWWGRLWTLAWWLIVFGISGAAYVYYLQPIVTRAEQYYAQFQSHTSQGSQNWEQQVASFFQQLLKAAPGQAPAVPQSGQ